MHRFTRARPAVEHPGPDGRPLTENDSGTGSDFRVGPVLRAGTTRRAHLHRAGRACVAGAMFVGHGDDHVQGSAARGKEAAAHRVAEARGAEPEARLRGSP